MIKILHTADIHLDSPLRSLALRDKALQNTVLAATRAAFRKIVDLALEEEVAALLLAGDVFDGARRSAQTLAFLRLQMERLNKAQIPVYYIKGNHDAENPLSDAMDWPENVTVFGARDAPVKLALKQAFPHEIYIHGVSFSDRRTQKSLLPNFAAPIAQAINIGLLHTSLNGTEGHDAYAPCSVAELATFGYDYWALGHIHKRAVYQQTGSLIVMPGTPQGRDIGEDGEKSVTMLCLHEDRSMTAAERPVGAIAFYRLPVSADGIEEGNRLRSAIENALHGLRHSMKNASAAVRLTISGKTPLHWQLIRDYEYWQNIAAELAADSGCLWLDKLVLQVEEPAAEKAQAQVESVLPTEELSRLMAAAADSAAVREECAALLNSLRSRLPRAVRADFLPDKQAEQILTQRFLEEGMQTVTAMLEGNSQAASPAEEEE